MTWIQLAAEFDESPNWDLIVDRLQQFGIENSQIYDTPPTLVVCLEALPGAEDLANRVEADLRESGADRIERTEVPDEDWAHYWKQFFKPQLIGEKVWVRPTWIEESGPEGSIEIILDPGQAFGTGDHPTTRMCLAALGRIDLVGKNLADLGCGSGILSIAAKKLGAEPVVGLDIDPQCVEASIQNSQMNGVSAEFVVGSSIADLDRYSADWDLVVSNIISATLIAQAPLIGARVRPGGDWLLSGVIHENSEDVLKAAVRSGFVLIERYEELDWTALHLRKLAR